jgi:hypothetical protein
LVEACGLQPLRGIKPVYLQGVNGLEKSEAYVINLSLPSKITFHELTVVLKDLGDVWCGFANPRGPNSRRRFSVKNVNPNTKWSFGITPGKGAQ